MAETTITAIVRIFIVALIAFFSFRKKNNPRDVASGGAYETTIESAFEEVVGRSALIEYTPTHSYENATMALVSGYLDIGKNVVLTTQAPRSMIYLERFAEPVKTGALRVVNITTENPLARPQMFRVGSEYNDLADLKKETDIISVSVNNLEYLSEITEEMEEGGVLVFETLTGLILALGKEKKEAVYKFFSSIVEEMSAKGRVLVALINRSAHESEIVSAYEGLFVKIFEIEDDSIVSLKGERVKIAFGVM